MPRTLKLTIAYDGTEFAGWQRQPSARTVQAVLEDALLPVEKRAVTLVGAGRTDAGVHAAAQIGSVTLDSGIALDALGRALNATLPEDVRVVSIEETAPGFNARHDARRKTYRYAIWNGAAMPPPLRRYALHVPQPLDLEAMQAAAAALVGEHDFASFQATGSDVKTTIRRLLASAVRSIDVADRVVAAPGDRLLEYEIVGTGFLRHMVRNIVGVLLEAGRRRRGANDVRRILASRDRAEAAATAPPHGLVLWKVEY